MRNKCLNVITIYTIVIITKKIACQDNQIKNPIDNANTVATETIKHGSIEQQTTNGRRRRKCCPYDFDSKLCQIIDDRVLCGFNRNVGKPYSDDNAINVHGGCRIRSGRLECGYEHGPFTNPRRPPGIDQAPHDITNESDDTGADANSADNDNNEDNGSHQQMKLEIPITTKKPRKPVTKCVEVENRIVCKNML